MSVELANIECVMKACALARTSAPVMHFVETTLVEAVKKQRMEGEYGETINAVGEMKATAEFHNKRLQEVSSKCWQGTATVSEVSLYQAGSINYMDGVAQKSLDELKLVFGNDHPIDYIELAYSIDESSQFNRGYVVNKQAVDGTNPAHQQITDTIDNMFQSWLVSNSMAADDDGVIYHREKNTTELKQKVLPKQISMLLEDPNKGFSKTVEKIDPNIAVSLKNVTLDVQSQKEATTEVTPSKTAPGV